ncbi:MAG: peptidase MA family metallohydrolase, partial [Chloroflexota bacterium]
MKPLFFTAQLLLIHIFLQGAGSPIKIQEQIIRNEFPDRIEFRIQANSSQGQITSAAIIYRFRNEITSVRQVVEFDPNSTVEIAYLFDTTKSTIPPSAPIYYYWELADSAGNRLRTDEQLYFYDDLRFDWQSLENESISVWWHDRPLVFGEQVFAIALQALHEQRELFQTELAFPIRVIINNSFEEFSSWHIAVPDYVGGQAFANFGITTQVVPDNAGQDNWLNNVIPHEISHLYFYQASHNPLTKAPEWIDEGIAQYNEFRDNSAELLDVAKAIYRGNYVSLPSISNQFGHGKIEVRLAYAEALSAITYLIEMYGETGLAQILS